MSRPRGCARSEQSPGSRLSIRCRRAGPRRRRCQAAIFRGSDSTQRSILRASAGGFSARLTPSVWSPPMGPLRLPSAYASRLQAILGDAKDRAELGPAFGPELTGAEVRYLMAKEWARFPDDILWRRSKLGLTMAPGGREALAAVMATAM